MDPKLVFSDEASHKMPEGKALYTLKEVADHLRYTGSDRARIEPNRVGIVNRLAQRCEQAHQRNDTERRYVAAGIAPSLERVSQRMFPDELGPCGFSHTLPVVIVHAVERVLRPSAASKTIRARFTSPCGVLSAARLLIASYQCFRSKPCRVCLALKLRSNGRCTARLLIWASDSVSQDAKTAAKPRGSKPDVPLRPPPYGQVRPDGNGPIRPVSC